jgi:hypothetical protein
MGRSDPGEGVPKACTHVYPEWVHFFPSTTSPNRLRSVRSTNGRPGGLILHHGAHVTRAHQRAQGRATALGTGLLLVCPVLRPQPGPPVPGAPASFQDLASPRRRRPRAQSQDHTRLHCFGAPFPKPPPPLGADGPRFPGQDLQVQECPGKPFQTRALCRRTHARQLGKTRGRQGRSKATRTPTLRAGPGNRRR